MKLFDAKGIKPEFEIVAMDQYETTLQTRMHRPLIYLISKRFRS